MGLQGAREPRFLKVKMPFGASVQFSASDSIDEKSRRQRNSSYMAIWGQIRGESATGKQTPASTLFPKVKQEALAELKSEERQAPACCALDSGKVRLLLG